MSAHSPGPWFAYYGYIIGPNNEELAEVKHEADQILMAAAPELLETLRQAIGYVASNHDPGPDWQREAEALIARVEGTK